MTVRPSAALLMGAVAMLGCGSPPAVVPSPPELRLQRDHYVLQPEPPPPRPRSYEEQRALEAEWPPVEAFIPLLLPPEGPARVRQTHWVWRSGLVPAWHEPETRCLASLGDRTTSRSESAVLIRVRPSTHRSAPRIYLEEVPCREGQW